MTDPEVSADRAKRVAAHALASGMADDALAQSRGQLVDPLRIHSPDGRTAGWMVPIELDGTLLGFVQVHADGRFHRYASFGRRPGTTEGCPPAAAWLDEATIMDQARTVTGPNDRLSSPELTYDTSPDRLAWAIRAISPDGKRATVFVAGSSAWRSPT